MAGSRIPAGRILFLGLISEIFLLVRTFAPKNFKKIAAKAGKSALCCRLYDEGSVGIPKWIRPSTSRPHGLKFFSAKKFWSEILQAGFFSARNLKNRKIFRSKVEKRKKSWRKSWKKGVSYTTNSLLRRKSFSGTQAMAPGNP